MYLVKLPTKQSKQNKSLFKTYITNRTTTMIKLTYTHMYIHGHTLHACVHMCAPVLQYVVTHLDTISQMYGYFVIFLDLNSTHHTQVTTTNWIKARTG